MLPMRRFYTSTLTVRVNKQERIGTTHTYTNKENERYIVAVTCDSWAIPRPSWEMPHDERIVRFEPNVPLVTRQQVSFVTPLRVRDVPDRLRRQHL